MGERFMEMLRFAIDTLGDLKKCNLFGEAFADIELTTPDGKNLKITMAIEEDNTNA